MKTLKVILAIVLLSFVISYAHGQVKKPAVKKPVAIKKSPGTRVKLTTDLGVIVIRLYDSTPLHRDNFVKLVKSHFFDSLLFHRVIKGFMIQGGDPLSKNAQPGEALGMGGGDMQRIPAEFRPGILHKKGVLAAARDGNPEKASSACQFYLVQGRVCSDAELNQAECSIRQTNPDFYYTDEQRKMYKTIGGTPMLDMNYTVFGEIEKGIEVVDKIANMPTAPGDRPLSDIRMKMEIVQ